MKHLVLLAALCCVVFFSCKKEEPDPYTPSTTAPAPRLIFKFKFDSLQARLDAFGNPVAVPGNHSAQSPVFHGMSAHYIELAPSATTLLGGGHVLYHAPETSIGGGPAIAFDSSVVVGQGQTFYSIPISQVSAGSYQYLRVSLAYQNYDVKLRANSINFTGRVASFIGFNTYISTYSPNTIPITINGNKAQGYWAFEAFSQVTQGQAPPGATTVVNPIWNTSPIPSGSCVVTAAFPSSLVITGNETQDIVIEVSLSTNNSFEWVEHSTPNIYEPLDGDTVVDMGVRGMVLNVQ